MQKYGGVKLGITEEIFTGLLSVAQVVINDHTDFKYPAHTSQAPQKEFDGTMNMQKRC